MALWIVAFNYLIAYASWINESDERWSVQTLQKKINHLKGKKLIDQATFNKLWDKIAVTDLQQSDLRKYLVKLSEENEKFQMMEHANVVQRLGFSSQDWYEKKYVHKMRPFRFPVGRSAIDAARR